MRSDDHRDCKPENENIFHRSVFYNNPNILNIFYLQNKFDSYFVGIEAIALSVIAEIESDGFTPGFEEIADPSQTYIFE